MEFNNVREVEKALRFEKTNDDVHSAVAEYIASHIELKTTVKPSFEFKVLAHDLTFEAFDEQTESFYGTLAVEVIEDGYVLSFEASGVFDEFGDAWDIQVDDIQIHYVE